MALTLCLDCGLTTGEVARMFLVQESIMAARLDGLVGAGDVNEVFSPAWPAPR